MWLQCEREPGTDSDGTHWERVFPGAETLKSLAELNEQCLELLTEQATQTVTPHPPMLRELAELWRRLDVSSRRRAAACPYLLVDAGFTDPYRWRWVSGRHIGDREPASFAAFFTVPGITRVANNVFNSAWYVTRTQPIGAPLFLGMPTDCANFMRACPIRHITELAERHADWLRPRWANRPRVWRELLLAAIADDGAALESARMHGVQLLATELRALEQVQATARQQARGV